MKKLLAVALLGGFLSLPLSAHSAPLPSLDGFYKWFLTSPTPVSNNVGDPFHPYKPSAGLTTERRVIEHFGPLYGFAPNDLWGLVTFSGTDANSHGLYFGSKYLEHQTGKKPIVYMSDSAHYTHRRLADSQNLEVRLVASNKDGSMNAAALEKALDESRPALMLYSMGTTFKGGIDNQKALNAVLARHPQIKVYRHVDSALFGGYLPYTKYKGLVSHSEQGFDSIAISSHKFFGLDEPAGLFLTTAANLQAQKFPRRPALNEDMPMLSGSRSGISPLKFKWLIDNVGSKVWGEQAREMIAGAQFLYDGLKEQGYYCWLNEGSNTVYLHNPGQDIVDKYHLGTLSDPQLGEIANIQVMPTTSRKMLQNLLQDIIASGYQ